MKKRKPTSLFRVLGSLRTGTKQSSPLSSLTRRIFAMEFISEFILIYPFYSIMFGERSGISAAGLGILLAIWQVVAVVSEVPTGIIADKISKKWSLVIAKSLQAAAFIIWLFVPSFTGYAIGFVIWGIGEAFSSGAFQAYLYESLADDNKKAFGKILARSSSMMMLAYASANIVAFGVGPKYDFLLAMSVLASLVAVALCLTLPDKKNELEVGLQPRILHSAIAAIRSNQKLRRILIVAVILQGLALMLFEFLPVYYNQVGTPTKFVPLILAITSGITVALYWWMHHVEQQLGRYLPLIVVVATLLLALSFAGGVLVAVIGMLFFTRVMRLVAVSNETAIQHEATNDARATIGSLYSFAAKLLSAGLIATIGFFAIHNQIVGSLRVSVFVMVGVFAVVVGYFALRERSISRSD